MAAIESRGLICPTLKGLKVPKGTLSSNGFHQVYLKWEIKIIGRECKRNEDVDQFQR